MTDATEGESTWDRLRRRKLVQWGVDYAAGDQGLLQGVEYVTSTFDWPRQFQQLATIALLIGLPIAVLPFQRMYAMAPEQLAAIKFDVKPPN